VWIVCVSLIIGGAVLLWIDRLALRPRYHEATKFPLLTYLWIGFCQCLAMVPGVSRSGATIVSAMLLGADRRSAAEFSFYLAMPTMAGAFAYELYKSWHQISAASPTLVAIGFVVSFISAWVVVKTFLDYVSSHGFGVFAWWRIIVGSVGLVALGLFR
jgi:undecaprenyl-diphosphatase